MNILLVGSKGKMSSQIKELSSNSDIKIVCEIDKKCIPKDKNCFKKFKDISQDISEKINAVLDFCSPKILSEEIEFCLSKNLPLIICSTGHNQNDLKLIKKASKTIPIFLSPNTSFSINLIANFLKKYHKYFSDFDIDIIEAHHKSKVDIPSGTAKMFCENLHLSSPKIHSLRAGNIVGNHDIIFTSNYEQISISHTAFDRKLFAKGAIDICKFFSKKMPPKLYTMDDIFNDYV